MLYDHLRREWAKIRRKLDHYLFKCIGFPPELVDRMKDVKLQLDAIVYPLDSI